VKGGGAVENTPTYGLYEQNETDKNSEIRQRGKPTVEVLCKVTMMWRICTIWVDRIPSHHHHQGLHGGRFGLEGEKAERCKYQLLKERIRKLRGGGG